MADDAVNRGLTAEQVNPFLNVDTLKYLGDEVSQQLYDSTSQSAGDGHVMVSVGGQSCWLLCLDWDDNLALNATRFSAPTPENISATRSVMSLVRPVYLVLVYHRNESTRPSSPSAALQSQQLMPAVINTYTICCTFRLMMYHGSPLVPWSRFTHRTGT